MNWISRFAIIGIAVTTSMFQVRADDWPQWMGPGRDSHWRETGIIDKFPASGAKIKWRAKIHLGYAGPAVSKGSVFLLDYEQSGGEIANNPGGRTDLEGKERVVCLDAESGEIRWKHEYPRKYSLSYASGPRCTPTVDGDRVYALGAEGNFWCLNAQDGKVIWSKDFGLEYKTETPLWGHCAHPLVDEKHVYCIVGGEGSVAVAFDKKTGKEVWRALSAPEPGYCPPTMIEHAGSRQLLVWHTEALNSLNPQTGSVYWTVPLRPDYRMSIAAPRKSGEFVYVSGIGSVATLLKLNSKPPAAEVEWKGNGRNAVYCANSTPFIENGVIYGSDCQVGSLMAVRLSDGERLWQSFAPTSGGDKRASHGTAHLVKNGDRFFLFSETGDLIIARLTPKAYEEISRSHIVDPTAECFGRNVVWSHPAFAERCAFVRNDKEIACVDLAR